MLEKESRNVLLVLIGYMYPDHVAVLGNNTRKLVSWCAIRCLGKRLTLTVVKKSIGPTVSLSSIQLPDMVSLRAGGDRGLVGGP